MNLIERSRIVEAITPQAGGSAIAGDIISMKHVNHVTVLVHVNQANAATVAITLEQAKDVSGTDSKVLAKDLPIFTVADAATSDDWERQTDGVAYTTDATLKHKLVAFEVDTEDLDVTNGFNTLQVKVAASNAANIVAAQYIASGERFHGKSLLAD